MSEIQIKAFADIPTERWRNGGGLTTTVAQSSDDWRVSVARIQSEGPYSRFEGIRRVSLVLRGAGVTLEGNGTVVTLKPAEAIEYDGGCAWQASLVDGPVTVLNVMRLASFPRPNVSVVVRPTTVPPNCTAVLIALDDGCRISEAGTEEPRFLASGQVAIIEDARQALTVSSLFESAAAGGYVKLPVLVIFEPANSNIG
jgi:environmental stress-induced protein Ves